MTFAARPSGVLIDTSAYFALVDRRDGHHGEAVAILNRLIAERWRAFTTNFVVAETHALILNRLGYPVAARILTEIDRSATTIVRGSVADEQRARQIVAQYQDKDFSLTDAISFAVMERLHISHAFSFDRHFAQYGFTVIQTS
jgi:predicted nucleic acid-binding protein